ncbi:MAG TPA: DUF4097 family beta strand repeat-containing protein [Bryobacteraceae bacterium]|nr:DUF4097 family beta strand repeat-containing protein [Bryobacteraceae bacterium]
MNRSILFALALAAPLAAQTPCEDNQNRNRDRSHCEMREYTLANAGRMVVDSHTNGGIRVVGSDRTNVLIRAKVQTNAPSAEEAKALAAMVRVEAIPGSVRANGPTMLNDRGWAVSYEVLVPRRTALELKAHNGGINISDVDGDIQFETQNGGVNLERLAGDVKGRTVNGGVKVELAGNTWRGNQLDVATTNGGINITVPETYSARLETSTVNGNFSSDVPGVQVAKDRRDRNVSVTLGSGGPLLRLVTTNGGIRLNKS